MGIINKIKEMLGSSTDCKEGGCCSASNNPEEKPMSAPEVKSGDCCGEPGCGCEEEDNTTPSGGCGCC